jgi:hypothetical protein
VAVRDENENDSNSAFLQHTKTCLTYPQEIHRIGPEQNTSDEKEKRTFGSTRLTEDQSPRGSKQIENKFEQKGDTSRVNKTEKETDRRLIRK